MKKGFTILELLVASLLLGMLVTILTMIFEQSSIAWRTGVAGVADFDAAREDISEIREEADSVYFWGTQGSEQPYRLLSPWDENGNLRTRAISVNQSGANSAIQRISTPQNLEQAEVSGIDQLIPIAGSQDGEQKKTYIINVKSAGPDHQFGTWDDIWSFPDDFD